MTSLYFNMTKKRERQDIFIGKIVTGLFPAGLFPALFSQLGLFPAGIFPARSFPRQYLFPHFFSTKEIN